MNAKHIIITIFVLIIIALNIRLAIAQTNESMFTDEQVLDLYNAAVHDCNDTSILTDRGCESCGPGWVKKNSSACEFSKECMKGQTYSEILEACETKTAKPKCVKGYKLVENKTYTKTYNDTIGAYTDRYQCVPEYWTWLRITLFIAGIAGLIWLVFDIRRVIKKKQQKGDDYDT